VDPDLEQRRVWTLEHRNGFHTFTVSEPINRDPHMRS
jgi:hypothetical protein